MKFGYARISTPDQKMDSQIDLLVMAGVDKENIHTDVSSGVKKERPGLDLMLSKLRKGDEVIVFKLDRIARSVRHISKLVEMWEKMDIKFRSINEPFFDTTSAHGKFIFMMFACIAQLERDMVRERTLAGLASASKRGRHGGRPPGLSKDAKKKAKMVARLYRSDDNTVDDICELIGISKPTVYRYLRHEGIEPDGYAPRNKQKDI